MKQPFTLNTSLFGLIGYPLGHSFSKSYFTQKFEKEGIRDCSFDLFPITNISFLPDLISQNPNLKGLNVTIPYKESVIQYLDSVDPLVKRMGAVNVIKIDKNGKLQGFNSDYDGFEATLLSLRPANQWKKMKALVFGTGGSSKAVIACLEDFEVDYRKVSRKATAHLLRYEEIGSEILEEYTLLVHCTPLGMHPNSEVCIPIQYGSLTSKHIAIDLVYNPDETMFMRKVKEQGGTAVNGLIMLHAQAEKAWEIWNS
jgi:shikimate dehydrogenase